MSDIDKTKKNAESEIEPWEPTWSQPALREDGSQMSIKEDIDRIFAEKAAARAQEQLQRDAADYGEAQANRDRAAEDSQRREQAQREEQLRQEEAERERQLEPEQEQPPQVPEAQRDLLRDDTDEQASPGRQREKTPEQREDAGRMNTSMEEEYEQEMAEHGNPELMRATLLREKEIVDQQAELNVSREELFRLREQQEQSTQAANQVDQYAQLIESQEHEADVQRDAIEGQLDEQGRDPDEQQLDQPDEELVGAVGERAGQIREEEQEAEQEREGENEMDAPEAAVEDQQAEHDVEREEEEEFYR